MADQDRDKNRDAPNQNNITQDGDPAGKADPAVRPVGTDDPNVERLREDIDSGKTGDKVGYTDPAAAPLGADAEAGGAPTTTAEVAQAHKAEASRPDAPTADTGRPVSSERPGPGGLSKKTWIIGAIVVVLLLLVIL